jgi:hypothetical protein
VSVQVCHCLAGGRHASCPLWSKADICVAKSDVRFTPNSDRENGLRKRSCLLCPWKRTGPNFQLKNFVGRGCVRLRRRVGDMPGGGGSTRYRDAPPGPTPSLPAQRIAKVVECSGDRRVCHQLRWLLLNQFSFWLALRVARMCELTPVLRMPPWN